MKHTLIVFAALAALSAAPAGAQGLTETLTVTKDTVTFSNGQYNYDYVFTAGGPGSTTFIDNVYLSSDELGPQNVTLSQINWTYLGNDNPYNYLQFLVDPNTGSITDSLTSGSQLEVTFTSPLAPSNNGFASGYDSANNQQTQAVTGILVPTATPEPGALVVLGIGILSGVFCALRRRQTAS